MVKKTLTKIIAVAGTFSIAFLLYYSVCLASYQSYIESVKMERTKIKERTVTIIMNDGSEEPVIEMEYMGDKYILVRWISGNGTEFWAERKNIKEYVELSSTNNKISQ